ncbi:DUF5908 family protein [Rhodovulum marinum]|uniref:Uncharacterized protein n=1 Tax=Rhodovulum marinum TaxID=320662 RepID=A0A4R2PVX1_9RHOB|nr:DUF5908 family protein [Rhodovulum marinum]TCP40180.1 hypothetical protein EV662_10854 [Rhodovulum marinum]
MAIEIGTLVVRGTFGTAPRTAAQDGPEAEERLRALREEILDEVREMMAEAERRARER